MNTVPLFLSSFQVSVRVVSSTYAEERVARSKLKEENANAGSESSRVVRKKVFLKTGHFFIFFLPAFHCVKVTRIGLLLSQKIRSHCLDVISLCAELVTRSKAGMESKRLTKATVTDLTSSESCTFFLYGICLDLILCP